jgi:peptide chain release factor 2
LLSRLKKEIDVYDDVDSNIQEFDTYIELISTETDAELLLEAQTLKSEITKKIDALEIKALLSGKYDAHNCVFSIFSGAGGTDAQDWVQILLRMYVRWFEKQGFKVDVIDETLGEEAGIKSVTLIVSGEYAYGYLKNENGVHRMVRLSPFNANNKRQTSFAAVDVIPKIESTPSEIDIDPKTLKIDTFRASGAGGQHVNKTDSAVRITHLPTNIVVTSQSSRSQGENKAAAMGVLISKLMTRMESEHKAHLNDIRGDINENAWGNQIRSYVFHPYNLVKDLRSGVETSNLKEVLDGHIDLFINSGLRNKQE